MATLDPGHYELVSYLVAEILHKVISKDTGQMIDFNIPTQQGEFVTAVEETGIKLRARLLTLG
jgi:hypothetical protein